MLANVQSKGAGRVRGTVLIVTIWVVLVLAGLALVFARSMRVAAIVSANHVASLEAECVAAGALEYVIAQLSTISDEDTSALEGADSYQAMELGRLRWRCCSSSPA